MIGSLGKYELRRILGRGGAGIVYEGWDPSIARKLAIKTVRIPAGSDADDADALARFRREAQAAGRLSHPNIVGIFDYGETDDVAYIVMEHIEGETLQAVIDRGESHDLVDVVRLVRGLLLGLGYSHSRGVIHRDIKPANLMLTREGELKIADFGIARLESSTTTQIGMIMGTPAYMSPEQILGQEVDARTDLYSAGVILYLLLTGQKPFEGNNMTATMQRALHETASPPSRISVRCPPVFDPVVGRAMAKKPAERFETAAAFAAALTAASSGPAVVEPEHTVVQRVPPPASPAAAFAAGSGTKSRGKTPLVAAIAVGAVALAAAGWWLLAPAARPPRQTAAAPESPTPDYQAGATPSPFAPSVPPPPAPAPAPAPPAAIPSPAVAGLAPDAARRDLDAALLAAPCALLRVSEQADGSLLIGGLIGEGASFAALQRTITGVSLVPPARQAIRAIPTPPGAGYCRALAIARPLAGDRPASTPAIQLAEGRGDLVRDDPISLTVRMPDFSGDVQIDYLTSDGTTYHVPQDRPARSRRAGETVQPGNGGVIGTVGAPFGTDLILVTVSSPPLFARSRAGQIENTSGYLRDLQAAIDAARSHGGQVAASVATLHTTDR